MQNNNNNNLTHDFNICCFTMLCLADEPNIWGESKVAKPRSKPGN